MAESDCTLLPVRGKQGQTRAEYLASIRMAAKSRFTCMCCGMESVRAVSGSNRAKGFFNKFCSMDCRTSVRSLVRSEVSFYRGLAAQARKESKKSTQAIRLLRSVLCKVAAHKARADRPCVVCGGSCGYVFGRSRKYCSRACSRKSEAYKAGKRASKQRRRAIERGSHDARLVDPFKVFDRDGWLCQMCGVDTPKALRGTIDGRAPELDHIVPLSRGGTHEWSNLQCLCRDCNIAKGNSLPKGQIGLFTSLMGWGGK